MPLFTFFGKKTGKKDLRRYKCVACGHKWSLDHDGLGKKRWALGSCEKCGNLSLPLDRRGYEAIMGRCSDRDWATWQ